MANSFGLRRNIGKISQNRAFNGVVISWVNNKVDVDMGGRIIHNVQFVGGPAYKGQPVIVDMTSGKPVAQAMGQTVEIPDIPKQITRSMRGDPQAANNVQISATQILGVPIDQPVDTYIMAYDATAGRMIWEAGGGVGGGHTIQDEGSGMPTRDNLNFVGAGVAVTDDSGNNATIVTISAGGGGMENPMTAAGDLIVGGTAGAAGRLPIGDENEVFTVKNGTPSWEPAGAASVPPALKVFMNSNFI